MNRSEVHIYRDGRVRLSGSAYHRMRVALGELAQWKCELCGKYTGLGSGEVDHIALRGMGGAKRDDRIMVEGKRQLRWVCRPCHDGRHVPPKVVPRKQQVSDQELKEILGL